MIEKFKINIDQDKKTTINSYIKWLEINGITFRTFMIYMENLFNIGFSYFIANKTGCSYEQIHSINHKYFLPSKSMQLRMVYIVKEMAEQESIEVEFDVKPEHKNYYSYIRARQVVRFSPTPSGNIRYTMWSTPFTYTITVT